MRQLALSSALLLALGFTACGPDENEEPQPTPTPRSAFVQLNYDFKFDQAPFALDQFYALPGGAQVKYTLATYYLAQGALQTQEDESYGLEPEHLIIRPGVQSSLLRTAPLALESQGKNASAAQSLNLRSFDLSIGVDEASNTEDGERGVQPSDFSDPNHPLAPQPEGMYWTWASGYIFVKMEGEIDYDADGVGDANFVFHLGTNEYRKDRSLALSQALSMGDTLQVVMQIDYAKVFDQLDLTNEIFTMSMGNERALGFKVMDNFDAAVDFSLR